MLLILWIAPDGGMGEYAATRTDLGRAPHNRMRHDLNIIAQRNVSVNNGIRADGNTFAQFHVRPDDRCRMNTLCHI
jgi:hypothetical protein